MNNFFKLYCANPNCDFEVEILPASTIVLKCLKCWGTTFTNVKGLTFDASKRNPIPDETLLKDFVSDNFMEELKLQTIQEGEIIPDGFSDKALPGIEEGRRLSIALQVTLPGNLVVRFRLRVPQETASKPETWSVSKLLYFIDNKEFKVE